MKIKITDMREFLLLVEDCAGDVYLVYPQGGSEELKGNFMRQSELVDQWRAEGQSLTLTLDVDDPGDLRRFTRLSVK